MKRRLFSLLLVAALCFSLLPGTAARAVNSDSGMVISKTAKANGDGSYTISLEAYATGEKVISETEKDKPTDIILVLDQSGSMISNTMATETFTAYTNKRNDNYFQYRHNGGSGNLWHLLPDGSYASVSVTVTDVETSYESFSGSNSDYYNNRNNLYILDNGVYKSVSVSRETGWSGRYYGYIYTYSVEGSVEGNEIGTGFTPFYGGNDNPPSGITFYTASVDYSNAVYTYTYTDTEGTHTITTSTGSDTECEETFYSRTVNNNSTRLDALKIAATSFVDSVAEKAKGADGQLGTDDDISHRIAVVGFAHGTERSTSFEGGYDYVNTELFIGATQYTYGSAATAMYGSAYQAMNTTAGVSNVNASIGALAALGATQVDLGMEMAQGILNKNTVDPSKRNQVVIVFTDGFPSSYSSFSSTIANSAIDTAKTMKANKVTVYSIGVFDGADATSAGSQNGNDTQKSNWFLQNLSSNNGTPPSTTDDVSYYLSAADSSSLNSVFKKISEQIESGGTTATLSEETVIKDIVSPSFTLPEGATAADITLETYHCTGKNGDVYTWRKNETAMGAEATVDGDQVSVTGFDFKENYVGTVTEANGSVSYRGDKLVISFTVTPKAGFLGGNDVYTNSEAGVYEDDNATDPVLTFNQPQVNVPIQNITITKADKNVYLLEDLTAAKIRSGVSVKVGDVPLSLDPTAVNYGLADWQTEYVTITLSILDENNQPVSDLNALTSDKTYSISVSVAPKTSTPVSNQGDVAVEQTGNDSFKVNVFKPVLTFKDGTVDYGSAISTTNYYSDKTQKSYESDNYVSTKLKWMHESTDSADVTMLGTVPALTKTYQYDTTLSKVDAAGKVISKDFVGVDVTVKIGSTDVTQYVTFAHDACTSTDCTWVNDKGDFEFLLHVINKCADLTIQKQGIQQIDNDGTNEVQSVIFHIKGKTNGIEMDVVIHGNGQKVIKDLPIDTYTVTEKTDWSWRYTPDDVSKKITLDAGAANSLTFTNTRTNPYWLNGGNYAHNVFGN